MKKTLNLVAVALFGVAMLSLSSCLSGGNGGEEPKYKKITKAEQTVIMSSIVGNYSGQLKFVKGPKPTDIDSVKIAWTVTNDTILVIDKFPVRVLTGTVSASETFVKQLGVADPVEVKMKLKLPNYTLEDYYNKGYYLASPIAAKDFDITIAGKPGKLAFTNVIQFGSMQHQQVQQLLEYYKEKQVIRLLVKQITYENTPYEIKNPVVLQGKKIN
mgnify:FL=1|jgi:hypothetical protein